MMRFRPVPANETAAGMLKRIAKALGKKAAIDSLWTWPGAGGYPPDAIGDTLPAFPPRGYELSYDWGPHPNLNINDFNRARTRVSEDIQAAENPKGSFSNRLHGQSISSATQATHYLHFWRQDQVIGMFPLFSQRLTYHRTHPASAPFPLEWPVGLPVPLHVPVPLPWQYPQVDPWLIPITTPTPLPVPVPVPRHSPSPEPGTAPVPAPSPTPRPAPKPSPRGSIGWAVATEVWPRYGQAASPLGKNPPGKNEVEKKFAHWVFVAWNFATNVDDFLEVLWRNIPGNRDRTPPRITTTAEDVFNNWDDIDWANVGPELIMEFMDNRLKGRFFRERAEVLRSLRRTKTVYGGPGL